MESYIFFSFNNNNFDEFNNNINNIQDFYLNNTDLNRSFNIDSSIFSEINENLLCNNKNNFIKKYNVYIKKNNNYNNLYEYPVCYNNTSPLNHKILDCKHFLCNYCYEKWNEKCCKNNIKISCPLCRK